MEFQPTSEQIGGVYPYRQSAQLIQIIPSRNPLFSENPINDLISDEVYSLLMSLKLLDEKAIRNYHIRKAYYEYRSCDMSTPDAIEKIQDLYPYLEYETLRKIIYQFNYSKKEYNNFR